ncbi:aminotransferase GliI [Sclerotinia borealis F-4128]|uniref:Aminotransferase GliI n=1 Tax=Sclerotinia borealis (strain F-4128) TaxID=1432307 RepID=W9C3F4_SCLBF|nr:aminotransferase GliI [Sclerotinia borealis F-4128]
MANNLSSRMIKSMQYILPKLAATSHELDNENVTPINLSIAENYVIREELIEICKDVVKEKLVPSVLSQPLEFGGDSELREGLAGFFNTYFDPVCQVKKEHVILTAGVGGGLEALAHAICEDGDSVIIPGPYWFGMEPYLRTRPNVYTIVASLTSYTLDSHSNDLLPSLISSYDTAPDSSRIKAVILCNSHNPFSRCYSKESIEACMKFCQERNLHLISDELYALAAIKSDSISTMNVTPFISILSLNYKGLIDPDKVHVVWSGSKLFGLSGIRTGCLISQANIPLRTAISLLSYASVSTLSSLYLKSILSYPDLPLLLKTNSERLTASYKLLADSFSKWGIEYLPATEGIFIFAKLARRATTQKEADEVFSRLAKHGVLVSPGKFYNGIPGEVGWARVTFSLPLEVIEEAVARMETILGNVLK